VSEIIFPSSLSISPYILILASCLDFAIGDPRWLPHPVRAIGRTISFLESAIRRPCRSSRAEKAGGFLLVILVVAPVLLITYLIQEMLLRLFSLHVLGAALSLATAVYLTATTIASRELIASARHVLDALKEKDMNAARLRLSMIVGRDTAQLPEKGVLKATIETLAENVSDGVVAPLFYLVLGGLPLAMAYKAINTLDSMVGYKNDRYRHFGWAAARLDDAANYIPARLTGILITGAAFLMSLPLNAGNSIRATSLTVDVMLRDGRKHPSPNSGVPEAAYAGALGIVLGGPSTYNGVIVDKPFIGQELPVAAGLTSEACERYRGALERAISLTRLTAILAVCVGAVCAYLRSVL
jgi:adenosylcobinamide-phosphate synthase